MNLEELLSTLESPIVIRPTRRMTQGELESYLDKAADILRGNADHSEFRGYVFALLFYKRISDCFDEEVRTQVATLTKAGVPEDQALLLARDPQNHHFVVPDAATWATVARTAKAHLGQALNDAMLAIERANAHRQNNFDGILTGKIDFNKQDELPRDKLVNLINHFGSQTFDRAHVSDDLFGNAYEYLIRTRRWTPWSWPCRFPGKAPSSSTPAACTVSTPARPTCGLLTSWTPVTRRF